MCSSLFIDPLVFHLKMVAILSDTKEKDYHVKYMLKIATEK